MTGVQTCALPICGILNSRSHFELEDLLNSNFIPNCSVAYRKDERPYPGNFNRLLLPDWPLHIVHAQHGSIGYLDEIMAVHHVHSGGIWNGLSAGQQQEAVRTFQEELTEYLGKDYRKKIETPYSPHPLTNAGVQRKPYIRTTSDHKVKVSVVSPCYNHGKYVMEMVDSVLGQTFRDFELLIVNDGSTDDTAATLDKICNDRVRIIHTRNHGPSHARNLAIQKAGGEIILNLDADDKIDPAFLGKCVEQFDQHPNTGIVYSDVRFFGERTGLFELPPYTLETMLMANCIVSTGCFRREDWKKTGGYSTKYVNGYEDFDFWLSILETGREVYKINETLVSYRTYRNPEECRSGRRKMSEDLVLKVRVQAFQNHRKLYASVPAAYNHYLAVEQQYLQRFPERNLLDRICSFFKLSAT